MGKLKDLWNKYRPYSRSEVDNEAARAAEEGIQEEKKWRLKDVNTQEPFEDNYIDDHPQDNFFLYEHNQPKIKKSTESKTQRLMERFLGGYTFFGSNYPSIRYSQTTSELHQMQEAGLYKYFNDPHCRSIIENWTHYTIGGGIKIEVENKKVENILNQFRYNNQMVKREKDFVRMAFIEGELFIGYYINPISGEIKVRRIRPQEIMDVECHPGDIETKLAYHWDYDYTPTGTKQSYKKDVWVKDIGYDDLANSAFGQARGYKSKYEVADMPCVQFIKFGIDTEIRGRVPLQPVMRHLKYYEDWLMDRIRLNHERSKVVWVKEISGRMPETTERQRRAPAGGVMLVETENVKYRIEKPQINADDAKEDGLGILYTIGAGTSLPIHILNQRADQNVYASIRKADTPFSQYIRGKQEFFGEAFETMYREVLKQAVKAGQLPKTVRVPEYAQESMISVMSEINTMILEGKDPEYVTEQAQKMIGGKKAVMKPVNTVDIPMSLEFPEIIKEDMEAQAKVMQIHKSLGIVSSATLAKRAGYNWKHELQSMMAEEPQKEPEAPKGKEEEDDGQD
tara:strand:- start:5725 stop:7425 length:1701 start_codon:yes stop_codon:yes gene_type:complete